MFFSEEQKLEFHVVSHTHWDREWYQCFELFRLRLVDLMDHLLAIYEQDPDYIFHLDAQTVCLEDYLEICPHRRERLCDLIAGGRLLVGPWYVQNDFHLASGEATVRNLLIGSEIAREWGRCDQVGYAPDQFGLISQLPQIFQGFGIGSAVFGRGFNFFSRNEAGEYVREARPAEFKWVSPDGSTVWAIHLAKWYNNAQRFPDDPERALRYLLHVNEEIEPFCTTPARLLMNGVDHLEAQENLLPILEQLQRDLGEEAVISQTTLQDYIDRVSQLSGKRSVPRVTGELRNGIDLDLLQGTLSARRYLKTLNSRCQTLLELELEPLYAILTVQTEGSISYPGDPMRYLWKELIKNHAHDSLCGCSVDRVHQDNENRFLRILEAAGELRQRGVQELLNRIHRAGMDDKHYLVAVVNPLPYRRSRVVTVQVRLPLDEEVDGFVLLDPEGKEVAYEALAPVRHNRMTLSPLNLPGQMAVEEFTLRFFAEEVAPSGYAVYRLVPAPSRTAMQLEATDSPEQIENEFLTLTVQEDGRIQLLDREKGTCIDSLFSFEDQADLGDSYCFLPGGETDLSGVRPVVTVTEKNSLRQSLRLDYRLLLPAELDPKTNCRVGEAENRISMTLTLSKGSPVLDLSGVVSNTSKDHRLRLMVHTGMDASSSLAAQPFDCMERPRYPEQEGLNTDLSQPVAGWVAVRNSTRQVSVLTDGHYDYEYLHDPGHSLAFTCVRATGRIANDPFNDPLEQDGVAPAPEWAAPENQCVREMPFHLGICLQDQSPAALFRAQQCWSSQLLTGFDSVDPHKFMHGRPCVQSADLNEMFFRDLPPEKVKLPLRAEGVELQGDVVYSARKQREDRQGMLLRFFNPAEQSVDTGLSLVSEWREVMLDETPGSDWMSEPCRKAIGPKQIVGLEIRTGC